MKSMLCTMICCLVLPGAASALEGDIPAGFTEDVTVYTYSENCVGAWPIRNIVRDYNSWGKIKIGIDERMVAVNRQLVDFKTENLSVLNCCELLAKKCNCHVYAIRDFFYIAPELPPGFPAPVSHAPKAGPGPAPAPSGNGGAPPTPGGGPPKPPKPATPPTAKAPVDKPLPPLRPMLQGTGLADFPVYFPGLTPGSSRTVPWSHKPLKVCQDDKLPIVLLAYYLPDDPKAPTPEEAKILAKIDKDYKDTEGFFERLILEDPEFLAEVKGQVNFIMIPSSEPPENWPTGFTEATKKEGAALFLLKKDGTGTGVAWLDRSPACSPQALLQAIRPLLPPKAKTPPKTEVAGKTANVNPPNAANGQNGQNPPNANAEAEKKPKNDANGAAKVNEE